MPQDLAKIKRILQTGDDFLIVSHENPDGDAFGSLAAMGFMLHMLGKNLRLYNKSGRPDQFDWLTIPGPVHDSLDSLNGFTPQWVIIMDCGDLQRIGSELAEAAESLQIINIDHHLGNLLFGGVNWVDSVYSAVGEMLAELARELGLPLTGPLGEAIYLTIVTDTGYFSYGNTRPETLELAAELVRQGLNPGDFGAKLENQWTMGRLQLWAHVFQSVELFCNGQVAFMYIPEEILQRTSTTAADCDGLVNYGRRIKTTQVAVILREDEPGKIKFSMRSVSDVNVQKVAAALGGGGHRNASGGTLAGSLLDVRNVVLDAIESNLNICPPTTQ